MLTTPKNILIAVRTKGICQEISLTLSKSIPTINFENMYYISKYFSLKLNVKVNIANILENKNVLIIAIQIFTTYKSKFDIFLHTQLR